MANRLRTPLVLLAAGALLVSACAGRREPQPRRGRGRRRVRGRRRRAGDPDPRDRRGQVQRRDGPHRTARRRRLEPGPLRGPDLPVREHARLARRLHRERPRGGRLGAGLPEPRRARASTSSSARRFGYMDPMATVAEEFPDQTFLHLTGYKSNGKNFGNFFGAIEDMKYLAGMLAGSRAKLDGNPKIGYMATFPIPEELRLGNAIMLRRQEDLPRVHDGRPLHQHLARPGQREGGRRVALRRRRRRRLHRRRHAARSPTSPRRRASGASPTTTPAPARSTTA